ncbi:hypothetical protein AMK59_2986, partial [Oryctes borbonicus]
MAKVDLRNSFYNCSELSELDALLADLQNTVSPGATGVASNTSVYGSLNKTRQSPARESPISRSDSYTSKSGTYGKTQQTPTGTRSPGYAQYGGPGYSSAPGTVEKQRTFNNNLSELDTLLQDLSISQELNQSKYANVSGENGMNGSFNGTYNGSGGSPANYSRPSSAQNTLSRPPVDSLLEELNAGDVIYTGPKKVTITVKETKTETSFPGDTELVSTHRSVTQTPPAASSATRELDDLMASLSDFKV